MDKPSSDPIVVLKNIVPKMKFIFIDGVKVGALYKESIFVGNGIGSRRREMLWIGKFAWGGEIVSVGRTVRVAELLPKIINLVRGIIIRSTTKHVD